MQAERVVVLLLFLTNICIAQNIEIPTAYGSVVGLALEKTYEFLGIPFAEPPVDTLRFAPPQPWTPPKPNYQQQATSYKAACTQVLYPEFYPFPGEPSEDCLYLNIYTPASKDLSSLNLPVMFWIHGGAFTGGSATENKYNGTVLASTRNVIVVSTNYRLGAFGFLADPSLCKETPTCGMWGILDQQAALQWVQDNIASFGGNPNNVTIFGESAGGMSVAVHLALSSSAGLFSGAIIESGLAEGYATLDLAMLYGANVTNYLGCSGVDSVDCMRNLPASSILDAQGVCSESNCWWPVINGNELDEQPLEYMRSGFYNQVPVLLGNNGNEGWLFAAGKYPRFMTAQQYEAYVIEDFGEFGVLVIEEYPISEYGSGFKALEAIIGDAVFVCPAAYIAEAVSYQSVNAPTYMYLFNHTPSWASANAGAYHGAEVNFVFGYRPDGDIFPFTPEEQILSGNMTLWWSTFATYGNPNPPPFGEIPHWPQYRENSPNRIVLDTGTIQYINQYRTQQCNFWREYYLQYYFLTDMPAQPLPLSRNFLENGYL